MSIIGLGLFAALIGGYLLARLRRHPRVAPLIEARLSTERWTGRPLTLVIVAAGGSAWIFAGVARDVVEHDGVARYDPRWHSFLIDHRSAGSIYAARVLTYLGSNVVADLVVVAAVIWALRRGRYWPAITAIPLLFLGQLLRWALAVFIHRPRPPRPDWLASAQGYAFPSGHTTTAVLAWGLVLAVTWPWLTGRGRAAAVVVVSAVAVVVGATRAYLGVHWPSDVLGGWALGGLLLTLAVTGLSLLRVRFLAAAEADLAPGAPSPRL
ncbi:phosphatase PAP2 family protein [Mycobacterium sp.]|uniref:phosphatase PAP2 family protein n=1 Tax=Mycobacterium sp. TaxID=1785 RepID=UPI0012703453|nr:phosphatase PAP2 family protein [Mycobacterium sp.]KAA8966160.1 MAG: phosphatase PAP2 family protein [Mycobacterium sp.]